MRSRRLNTVYLGLVVLAVPMGAAAQPARPAVPLVPCAAGALITEAGLLPGHELPVIKAYRYTMNGRIRPLLFWISRDGVGHGQITWRADTQGATAVELFISSDPARAPRGIDRWGYLVEQVHPAATRVTGVVSFSDETTLAQAYKRLDAPPTVARFKAIEARIDRGESCVATSVIETPYDRYQREIPTLVRQVRDQLRRATTKSSTVPAGVRTGFFGALVEMMNDTVAARRSGGKALARLRGRTLPYIYGNNLFDLALADVDLELSPVVLAPAAAYTMHAVFVAKARRTGETYKFELQYATEGEMSGVPTLIRYQPRWWLQVDLVLSGPERSVASLTIGGDATEYGDPPIVRLEDSPSQGEIADVQQVEHPDAARRHPRHDAGLGPVVERAALKPSALELQDRH